MMAMIIVLLMINMLNGFPAKGLPNVITFDPEEEVIAFWVVICF
jgi:hypothetical protein